MNDLKIKQTNNNRVILITAAVIIVLLLIIGGFFLYKKMQEDTVKPTTTSDNKKISNDIKSNSKPISKDADIPENSASKTSQDIPKSTIKTITLISTSQTNGNVDAVATTSAEGYCAFQYTTTDDKPVVSQSNTSNKQCVSSIPEIQFSKLGTWKLTATYYADNEKAETTKDVTIR